MKIISWNVNGIRAVAKKWFGEFVEWEQPDILCLQETKAQNDQVAETLAPNANSKGIRINIHVDPEIPDALLGDSVRLRQILFNIAGNAVKFTEAGSVTLNVSLVTDKVSTVTLLFEIVDTGIGIAEEKQKVIFEAFAQADTSATRKFGGTGLGLAISSQLADMMGGKIGVESHEDKGSRFYFQAIFGKENLDEAEPTTTQKNTTD